MKAYAAFLFFSFMTFVSAAGPTGMSSGWWRSNNATKLSFSANNSSLTTWSCTAVTVQRRDQANRLSTVGNHTVTLAGGSAYFYSDSNCTTEISNVVITAPANSATFYASFSAPGSLSFSASSGGLTSVVQNTTVTLNPYTWMGGGGNTDWTNTANWSGGSVPVNTTGHIAHFDANCVSNCSPSTTANTAVRGIHIHSGYSGTITQVSGHTMTIGGTGGGFIQNAGTFNGGDQDISVSGTFYLSGGTFRSTSATLIPTGSASHNPAYTVTGSPTFNTNGGTVMFTYHKTINPGSVTYNNVTFAGTNYDHNLNGNTMTVAGTLSFQDAASSGSVYNGLILASGDVALSAYGKFTSSTSPATVRLVGSSSQSVTAVGISARIPTLEIASTGGTVTFSGTVSLSRNFTYVSGSVDMGTSTLIFYGDNVVITPGSVEYYNVTFSNVGSSSTQNLNGGTMTVKGLLSFASTGSSAGSLSNGTILAYANVDATSLGKPGSAIVRMVGSVSQTVTATGAPSVPAFAIASTGGTVTFTGFFNTNSDFKYYSGNVDMGASTFKFNVSSNIIPGPVEFYDVTFAGANEDFDLNAGNMIVKGTLSLADTNSGVGDVNNGTIEVRGNATVSGYGKRGTAVIKIAGTGNQTLSGVDANSNVPSLQIISTGGTVTLSGTLKIRGDFTYSSGNVDASASTLIFYTGSGTKNVIPGSIAFNNVEFTNPISVTLDLNAGTMTVNGTLTLNASTSSTGSLINGTILASGNIVASNYGHNGTALIKAVGSASQTFTGSTNANCPAFEIDKSGGTLTFLNTVTFRQSFTYTNGTVSTGTSHIRFQGPSSGSASIVPGSFNYYDVSFAGSNVTYDLNAGTVNVTGTLTVDDTSASIGDINNGSVNAYGNLVFTNYGKEGTAILNIVGTTSATISDSVNARNFGTTWQINKTGGANVSLVIATNLNTAGQSVNVTGGNVLMSGFALTVPGSVALNGRTITKGGGVLTVGGVVQGTGSILGGTVN